MINFRMLKVSDKYIWIPVVILTLLGLLMIFSTTYSAEAKAGHDAWLFIKRQLAALGLGLVFMGFFTYLDYKHLRYVSWILYALMLLMLVVVQFSGSAAQGAQRWMTFGRLSFQPSEISKLIVIMVLASYFDFRREKANIITPLILAGIPFLMVFKQPDLGTALVILAIALGVLIWNKTSPTLLLLTFTPLLSLILRQNLYGWIAYLIILWGVLYFSRVKLKDLLLILGLNLVVGIAFPILWGMLKEYQRLRIVSFLNPGLDPKGMGYHTLQSKIAIGAGGLFGTGFMHGTQTQLQFIPIQHSDFIFSAVGEEFGLIGAGLTLFLFVMLIWRTVLMADEARDNFGSNLAAGIAVMLFFHVFVNIGMTLGLLPVVGIPLPFLSYGGTSLVMNLIAIGILQSVAMRRQKLIF